MSSDLELEWGWKGLPRESLGCKIKISSGQGQVVGCWVFGFYLGGGEGVSFTWGIWVWWWCCLVFNKNSPWNWGWGCVTKCGTQYVTHAPHTYLYLSRNASTECALWSSWRKMGWFQVLQVTGIQLRSPQTGNGKKIIRYLENHWPSQLHWLFLSKG